MFLMMFFIDCLLNGSGLFCKYVLIWWCVKTSAYLRIGDVNCTYAFKLRLECGWGVVLFVDDVMYECIVIFWYIFLGILFYLLLDIKRGSFWFRKGSGIFFFTLKRVMMLLMRIMSLEMSMCVGVWLLIFDIVIVMLLLFLCVVVFCMLIEFSGRMMVIESFSARRSFCVFVILYNNWSFLLYVVLLSLMLILLYV